MHYGKPWVNSGALSKIGIEHKCAFVIWGILTTFALGFNIICAYKRYNKTKIYIPLLTISIIGMILTLSFNFEYNKYPDYYLHCIGSLGFSAIMGVNIFILFASNYKKGNLFKAFTFISAGILLTDLICLLIFKETALIEVLPIFAGYILLCITNLRRDKVEAKR
jgi:uncharacterized membrane protein